MNRRVTTAEMKSLANNTCPKCGGHDFVEGPRGWGNINIWCDACKFKLNVCGQPQFADLAEVLDEGTVTAKRASVLWPTRLWLWMCGKNDSEQA